MEIDSSETEPKFSTDETLGSVPRTEVNNDGLCLYPRDFIGWAGWLISCDSASLELEALLPVQPFQVFVSIFH